VYPAVRKLAMEELAAELKAKWRPGLLVLLASEVLELFIFDILDGHPRVDGGLCIQLWWLKTKATLNI
jgi:hypothetical protein